MFLLHLGDFHRNFKKFEKCSILHVSYINPYECASVPLFILVFVLTKLKILLKIKKKHLTHWSLTLEEFML